MEEIGHRHQRRHRGHGLGGKFDLSAPFAGCHPLRDEAPCTIRELTAQTNATVDGALPAYDRQRLIDERMPGIVDGDATRKLRSM
jgi:hypothetical protein